MANLYNNKVVINNETIIDLSNDTVSKSDVRLGKLFHLANGKQEVGTYEEPQPKTCSISLNITSVPEILSYWGTKVDNSNIVPFGTSGTPIVGNYQVTLSNVLCNSAFIINCGIINSTQDLIVSMSDNIILESSTKMDNTVCYLFKVPANNVTGNISIKYNNTFNYTFETIDAINLIEGVWNQADAQIEF